MFSKLKAHILYTHNVGTILPNCRLCVLFVSLQIAIVSNAIDFAILFLNVFFIGLARMDFFQSDCDFSFASRWKGFHLMLNFQPLNFKFVLCALMVQSVYP